MKSFWGILLLFVAVVGRAELVKKGTTALQAIDGNAMVEFADSAMVYPYEPVYGKWRMIMWVGYVDTQYIKEGNKIKAGTPLREFFDFSIRSKTVTDFTLPFFNDPLQGNYRHLKKFALYLYIPDTAIIESTRMEPRFEAVAKAKKNKQWGVFEKFAVDFGFIKAELTGPYTMWFAHDGRSPEGANDFRMMVFTDTANRVVAVSTDGYRELDIKYKEKSALDRTYTIFYLIALPLQDRTQIETTFKEVYRFRD